MHHELSRRRQGDLETLITGGSFYTLENTGDGPMIMMGNRSGPAEKIQIIDYVTRKDILRQVQAEFNVEQS